MTARHHVARIFLGAVMISFAPVFVRLIDMPPSVSAMYRMLIGGLILAVIMRARGHGLAMNRRVAVALGLAGLLFAMDLAFWHRSILYVGPGLATLLGNLQVLVLAIVGVSFLGERLRVVTVLSIALAVVGLGLIVGFDWSVFDARYRWGLIFGLLTAAAYASYILTLRYVRVAAPESTPARDLTVAGIVAASFLCLFGIVEGVPMGVPSLADAGLLAGYAIVAQVLGWLLISSALPHVRASLVGLLLLLQPALAFVWDVLFFARPFTVRELVGGLVVLCALYLGARSRE